LAIFRYYLGYIMKLRQKKLELFCRLRVWPCNSILNLYNTPQTLHIQTLFYCLKYNAMFIVNLFVTLLYWSLVALLYLLIFWQQSLCCFQFNLLSKSTIHHGGTLKEKMIILAPFSTGTPWLLHCIQYLLYSWVLSVPGYSLQWTKGIWKWVKDCHKKHITKHTSILTLFLGKKGWISAIQTWIHHGSSLPILLCHVLDMEAVNRAIAEPFHPIVVVLS